MPDWETTEFCTEAAAADSQGWRRLPPKGMYRGERGCDRLAAVPQTPVPVVVDAALPPSPGKGREAKVLSHDEEDGPAGEEEGRGGL